MLSLDTLYYDDLDMLLSRLKTIVKPGGQLLAFFNLMLWDQNENRRTLLPDWTPLAETLRKHDLSYRTWDYTWQEYERALISRQVALELEAAFEAEGNRFLFENRILEANGSISFYEEGRMSRYLYRATV